MLIEGNKWQYCVPQENLRLDKPFGWCESCTIGTKGREQCWKDDNMSWGYCLPECMKREEGWKGRQVGQLKYLQVATNDLYFYPGCAQ